MPDGAVITFAASKFERDDLFVFALLDDLGRYFRAVDRTAVRDFVAVGIHQYVAESRRLSRLNVQKIDIDRLAFRDTILPAAGFDNCVSHNRKRICWGKSRANSHRCAALTSGKVYPRAVAASLRDARTFRIAKRLQCRNYEHNLAFRRPRFVVREQFGSGAAAEFFELLRQLARDAELSILQDVDARFERFR